jgi:uncharacterized membrane protein
LREGTINLPQKTSFFVFIIPALFDFADKILMSIAITLVAASLPAMIRSLIPAIAGVFSYFKF